jgi:SAM-dependent methyltransferase
MGVNRDLDALLALVVCPVCRGRLETDSMGLRCAACDAPFALHDRTPALSAEDGRDVPQSLLARLQYAILGNPRLYDFHQAHGGGGEIAAQVEEELRGVGDATLLDIGAGTGMGATLVPPATRYIWFDNDKLKLSGLLRKPIDCLAVLGDATRLPFPDRSADWTLMVEVSHHLTDDALDACLAEAARVTRRRFVFVDALAGRRLRSKLLWQLDLGRFPRDEERLLATIGRRFDVEKIKRFRINHDHLLCVCVPRDGDAAQSAS